MSGDIQCENVFMRKPHLRKTSRHLNVSDDHMNPRSFLTINGKRDESPVCVSDVSLNTNYLIGRRLAKKYLVDAEFPEEDVNWDNLIKSGRIDMLRPHGDFVGISKKYQNTEDSNGNVMRSSNG